jgi:hypothetical protein
MDLKHLVRRASLALGFAVTACTITTTSSDSCSMDSTVTGCAQGSSGYSCTGSATPAQSTPSLNCGAGVAGNAMSTLYCCVAAGTTATTCAPDITVSNCAGTSQGYSCSGSDTPAHGYPSLSCGPGAPGDAGSTLYCCTNAASADGGNDVGTDAVADGGNDAFIDGGTCSVGADTGSPTCDQCFDSLCCAALVACATPDAAGVNDAGASACEQLLQCTLDCLAGNPDAGVDAGTLSGCEAICNPIYTAPEQQSANALLQCQATNCTQQCQ